MRIFFFFFFFKDNITRKTRIINNNNFFINLNNFNKNYLDNLKKDINTFNLEYIKLNLFKKAYKLIKT